MTTGCWTVSPERGSRLPSAGRWRLHDWSVLRAGPGHLDTGVKERA
jgi:hypothetical protein